MRRLHTRIYLHLVGVLLVVGIASTAIFATGWRSAFLRAFAQRLAGHLAGELGAVPNAARRVAELRRIAEALDVELTLRDPAGGLLAAVGPPAPDLGRAELLDAQRGPAMVHHGRSWSVVAPVRAPDGALLGFLETTPQRRLGAGHLVRPLGGVLLLLALLGVATVPLARRISRPVERLTEASRRLGQGELGYRVPCSPRAAGERPDELRELTWAWNDMAERLEGLVHGQRELLANISHELRSPLARVRVALALIDGQAHDRARVSDVERDLDELERLIDDVLTTARLDATGLPVRLERVEVGGLLASLADRASHDPTTLGRAVTARPGEAVTLEADAALLRRALWNLVENAAKHGAPPITIAAERDGATLHVTVRDEGPGIPPAERARVLAPFVRGDRARTPGAARGFGLGLTLARRIAEVHGGTLTVDAARTDGTGCLVTLTLPLPP